MLNILTIDVEDYFQVENFKKAVKFSDWDRYETRVVRNTEKILDILASPETKATFFVLGWIGERYPRLVKQIYNAGHEVASHGYAHGLIYSKTPEDFRYDIRRSKKILEDIISEPVMGYRAPCYSITEKSLWALDILKEEGFKYDSSLFPIRHDHGGLPASERYIYQLEGLNEFPLSTVRIFGQNIPFSGGGYFRLLPYRFVKRSIETVNKAGYPAVMYFHPWELDPEQPRIKAGCLGEFRHYVNLAKTEQKMRWLLGDFKFGPVKDYLEGDKNEK